MKYIYDSLRAPLTGISSAATTKSPVVVPQGKSSAAATESPVVVPLPPLTGKSSAAATESPVVVPLLPLTGKSSAAATKSSIEVRLSPKAVEDVIKAVTKSIKLAGPDLVEIACGDIIVIGSASDPEVVSHDHNAEQSLVARNWKLLTTSLCLAHSSLQECQLMSRNPLVGAN
jgi:hypothetical protein